ncbi:MAG: signal peptide peptidase SppA [Desulfovibrio sp.]
MTEKKSNLSFSQRHPLLFGTTLIIMAVALVIGAMAIFGFQTKSQLRGEKIGVVEITGMITSSEKTLDWISTLRKDDGIHGVLLRVNSPGGTIAPSQEIYDAVEELATIKPVVASYGTVAASGGYYVSAPATYIVANPGSLTASIGVKMEYLNFKDFINRYGVFQEQFTSGANKGAGSPFAELTPVQREQLESIIADMHDQFLRDVAKARQIPVDVLRPVADGRALTGRQALEVNLVDELGSIELAKKRLVALCQVPEEDVVYIHQPEEDKPILQRILGALGVPAVWSNLMYMY